MNKCSWKLQRPSSTADRLSRQKTSKGTEPNMINQQDLTDIYRPLHSTTEEHTFYSSVHRTHTKTDDILSHKTRLNKFKITEIKQCVLQSQWNQTRNQK